MQQTSIQLLHSTFVVTFLLILAVGSV